MANEKRYVIAAGTTRQEIANLLPFARVLAQERECDILALGLVIVPENESLSAGARPAQKLRQTLAALARRANIASAVRVTHPSWSQAFDDTQHSCNLLLVNWDSALPADALRALPSDIVVVNGALKKLTRILLPIRGGPYAALALQVALAFAQVRRAEITLLHAAPAAKLKDKQYRDFFRHLQTLSQVTRVVQVSGDAVNAILRHAKPDDHQMIVLGAIAYPQPGDPPIGPTATRVLQKAQTPVLIVKTPHQVSTQAPPVDYTISVVVDKWFAENTFHAHEFANIKHLVAQKERQGLTISLGLPALNEQKTIGKVIKTVREAFVRRYPLLDEIVVIDSNSTDRTVEIAQDLGVPVYRHPDILPQYGAHVGKGEALWKSLFALKGDIIAWIDTDILNIHPRFVYGILGPLIQEPDLMYVKGFYQRPLRIGNQVETRGGGRVTELVARPMFNLFYPELSGLVQPLAGEYAGRRAALESVPFCSGYGVETGLLIDILTRYGLGAIGQVDLEERVHRNQPLLALSKMAFTIIQVVMQRVGRGHGVELLNELNKSMKLIRYSTDEFRLELAELRDKERPPMCMIPEYRHQRALHARR